MRSPGVRCLLTGHTGFKGSWLAIWLHHLGARVAGYSLPPPTEPSNFQAVGGARSVGAHYEADVRDQAALNAAVAETRPDVVFHLAAQSLVRESYQNPRDTFEVNVLGTVGVLEAVRAMGRPCVVVVVSSDKCYENGEQVWGYREIDPLGGFDPYSASKGAVEIVAAAYRRSFFPPDATRSTRREVGHRPGRQRHRRRRLGQGPHHPRHGRPSGRRPAGAGAQPGACGPGSTSWSRWPAI